MSEEKDFEFFVGFSCVMFISYEEKYMKKKRKREVVVLDSEDDVMGDDELDGELLDDVEESDVDVFVVKQF